MSIEVWPVAVVRVDVAETVTRGGRTHRCMRDRAWWADWHESQRGTRNGAPVLHHAQDIFAPRGSGVLAVEPMRVVRAGKSERGGWHVYASTPERLYYYAHLDAAPLVVAGQSVIAGEQLGVLGNSGNATHACPHLHLQAWTRTEPRQAVQLAEELRAVDPSVRVARRRPAALRVAKS